MYPWLLLLHVVAVLLLATGNIGALFVATRARRASHTRDVVTLMRMHHFMVTRGIIPGAIGALVSGVALVHVAGLAFTSTWVAGTLVGWVASLAVGLALLVPAETRALREGERLLDAKDDSPSAELRSHVGAARVWIGEWATVALLLAMTYFMVIKPA